jgi:hypothetical protein
MYPPDHPAPDDPQGEQPAILVWNHVPGNCR